MCSQKFSTLLDPDVADVMARAAAEVAERSFFAATERCDERTTTDRIAAVPVTDWLIASVRFDEADGAGTLSCVLPDELARLLFDAFNGRDPLDQAPALDEVFDLVGEFSNMICGTWLTRLASDHAFVLSRPLVTPVLDPLVLAAAEGARMAMLVNDLPLLIDVRFSPVSRRPGV